MGCKCTWTIYHPISSIDCTEPATYFFTTGSLYSARCNNHHSDGPLNTPWKQISQEEYEVAQVMEG